MDSPERDQEVVALLEADGDAVCLDAVGHNRNIDIPASCQAGRKLKIDLIQTRELRLPAGVLNRSRNSADCRTNLFSSA